MTSVDWSHTSNVRDKFCWNCHEKCLKIACPKCFRSFHKDCLKSTDQYHWNVKDKALASCTVCTIKEMSKEASVGMRRLLNMLKYTMIDILNNPDFRVFKDLTSLNSEANYIDVVVNPIDLNEISQKINSQIYNSFYSFLVDIEGIFHNCYVYYSERHDLTETAKTLFKFCEKETRTISSCAECYENKHLNPNEWRTMACSKPHLLLWARLSRSLNFWPVKKGFTHWPAKLISVDHEDLKVIFFESSECVDISTHDNWIYSAKHSNSVNQRFFDPNYIYAALKEVNLYGKKVEENFGRFQSELECIRFDRNKLNDHMAAMFPDYNDSASISSQTARIQRKNDGLNDEVPKKKARISLNVGIDATQALNTSLSSSVSDTNSLVWEHFNVKQILEEAMKTMNKNMKSMNADMMSIIDTNLANLLNSSKTKLAQTISKDEHAKELSEYQSKNDELAQKLQAMTSERDAAKSAFSLANEGKIKIARAGYGELTDKLRAMTSKRNEAKNALANAIESHDKEKMFLNESNKKYENDLIQANRLINDTIHQSENTLKDIKSEHANKMEALKTKLKSDYNESLMKSQKEHENQIKNLQETHKSEVDSEKQRADAEIGRLKTEHIRKVAKMETQFQRDKDNMKAQLEAKHKEASMNLQKLLEHKYNSGLNNIRLQHDNELKSKEKKFFDQIEILKKEHAKMLDNAEKKTEAAIEAKDKIEAKLDLKYQRIVASLKATAEMERSQVEAQGKRSTQCMCCGDSLKFKLFCNERCGKIWKTWEKKEPDTTDQ